MIVPNEEGNNDLNCKLIDITVSNVSRTRCFVLVEGNLFSSLYKIFPSIVPIPMRDHITIIMIVGHKDVQDITMVSPLIKATSEP